MPMRCDDAVSRDDEAPLRILVVGAGIAGLAMVRMLRGTPHRVTLAERSPKIRADGTGLVLPSSATRVLHRLGVDVPAIAHHLDRVSILDADGRARLSAGGRFALRRADLISALTAGVDADADVRLATTASVIESRRDGVRCEIGGRAQTFDVVVGADGARSVTRGAIAPDVRVRAAGQVCWRGIVGGRWRPDRATEMWTEGRRVGIVPLNDGRSYVYVVRSGVEPVSLGEAISGLSGAEAQATHALAALPEAELFRHELSELEHPVWGTGRVALLGDAAHAMTPNLGLGAFLALKDAEALGKMIVRSREPVRAYARRRRLTARSFQFASRVIGELAHSPTGLARGARLLLGLGGPSS